MTQMTAQVFFVTASARDVVTVPVSALHKGRGRAGGRTGSRPPKLGQGSAAYPPGWSKASQERFMRRREALKMPGAKRYFVLVAKPDGTIEHRPVAIGVTSRVLAQVLAGLNIGEQVVVGMKSTNTPARDRANGLRNGRTGSTGGPRFGGFP
jgi:macrolide-specific efflux system membrane fusion protein